MTPRFLFYLLLLMAGLTGISIGQGQKGDTEWFELLDDPNTSVSQVRELAKEYFERVGTEKGTGWKQFKRWEYYHSRRLDPQTPISDLLNTGEEVRRFNENQMAQRMTSSNGDWTLIGPTETPTNGTGQPNGLGRVNCIAIHPTDTAVLFLGTPSGGFWKSTDHGSTWNDLSSGFTRLGISSIVIHPTDFDTIYVGTGDRDAGDAPGYGVWRSTDGGTSWAARNTGMGNRTVYVLLMHPSNPDTLIASTSGQRVYRSTDAGASWSFSSVTTSVKDMQFKPGDPTIVYGGGYYNGSTATFSRSSDNGASWSQITSGLPSGTLYRYAIAVSANQPNWVYAMVGDPNGFDGLYRSTNSGVSFSTRSTNPNILGYSSTGSGTGGQAWYDHILVADPNDATLIYAGGINIWKSTNSGTSWSISAHWTGSGADDIHADQHFFLYSGNGNVLYNGNDGGIYYNDDAGVIWNDISSGLPISQIYKIGQAQTAKDLIISGYQDNGTTVLSQSGFTTEIGGDGMECTIDPTDGNFLYGALYYGDIRRSIDGGLNFSSVGGNGVNGINESGGWVTPYKLDPTDPRTMYAGYKNIWRSTSIKGSVSWTKISSLSTTQNVVDLSIAFSNNDVLYFSRADGSFYRSTNATAGSPAFSSITGSLPVSSIVKDIEIDPTDATHLWIAQGNNIYESTNSGTSWNDVSGTLPNISVNCIVYDSSRSNDALYVGMDAGVYYLDNALSDWVPFSTGLPNLEVTELEIYYDGGCGGESRLRAATYGRGTWESDLRDPGNLPPIACFETSLSSACVGQTIQLQDLSVYPSSWTWVISPGTFSYVLGSSATDQNPYVQFSSTGTYSVTLTATNSNGSDNLLQSNLITITSANSTPVSTDFESESTCGTNNDCGTTICSLLGGWSNGINGTEDDIDWRIDAGGTPSTNTGPSIDANPGNASGQYVYLEASGCYGQSAFLYSPCIDLTDRASINLAFQYHMYGADMGELRVDVLSETGWVTNITGPFIGDKGNSWNLVNVNLDAYTDQVIQIRFRGATGTLWASDVALDDINITSVSALPIQGLEANILFRKNEGILLTWRAGLSQVFRPENFLLWKLDPIKGWEKIYSETLIDPAEIDGEYMDGFYVDGMNYYKLEIQDPKENTIVRETLSIFVESNENFSIYPNPTLGIINLKVESRDSGPCGWTIYDRLGRTIQEKEMLLIAGVQEVSIDLQDQPVGLYFIRFRNRVKPFVIR
jgi:PKD repeat protein